MLVGQPKRVRQKQTSKRNFLTGTIKLYLGRQWACFVTVLIVTNLNRQEVYFVTVLAL